MPLIVLLRGVLTVCMVFGKAIMGCEGIEQLVTTIIQDVRVGFI